MGFASAAVRGRGGSAGEPRQALIGATVVCPDLPRIPWQHSSHRFGTSTKWGDSAKSLGATAGSSNGNSAKLP